MIILGKVVEKIYTILVTESNEMITSIRERIMQRSKLVDNLHFLVKPKYKEMDMSKFTVLLEYVLPVSKEYHSDILVKSPDLYKRHLEYKLPFDTVLTREAGEIELQLSFTYVEMNADGTMTQYVRKISPTTISIIPIAAWSDLIPDDALASIDQRLLKTDAMLQELADLADTLNQSKADNLTLEDDVLQLTSEGEKIGDPVTLSTFGVPAENDGNIKVVEF